MKKKPDGTFPYKGFVDCVAKTIKNDGIGSLWVGVNTYLIRVAPHAVISLIINEFMRNTFSGKKSDKKEAPKK
jgi:hypothetical protein